MACFAITCAVAKDFTTFQWNYCKQNTRPSRLESSNRTDLLCERVWPSLCQVAWTHLRSMINEDIPCGCLDNKTCSMVVGNQQTGQPSQPITINQQPTDSTNAMGWNRGRRRRWVGKGWWAPWAVRLGPWNHRVKKNDRRCEGKGQKDTHKH